MAGCCVVGILGAIGSAAGVVIDGSGMVSVLPHVGHSTSIPTQSGSASRGCPQCGQVNLKSCLESLTLIIGPQKNHLASRYIRRYVLHMAIPKSVLPIVSLTEPEETWTSAENRMRPSSVTVVVTLMT